MTPSRLTLLLSLLVGGALAVLAPGPALSPGAPGPGHQATRCLQCHSPVRGVTLEACQGCHPRDRVSERLDAGSVLVGLHRTVEGCGGCHREHGGAHRATFSHQALPPTTREDCQGCHVAPRTEVHAQARACLDCHQWTTWKGARVDHSRLAGKPCESCHAARRPDDVLHRQAEACAACHTTDAWRPATFEHSKFFVLDRDHGVACAQCHVKKGDYQTYDCTTCHEHSPDRLAHEHAEEGITDLSNCARCHRAGEGEGHGGEGEGHGGEGRKHEGGEEKDDD